MLSTNHLPVLLNTEGFRSGQESCSVSSPAAGGDILIAASSTPGAGGLQGFLVPPLVEPLDVVVASQEAISGLQFPPEEAQEVSGEMSPPVIDLTHYDVPGS